MDEQQCTHQCDTCQADCAQREPVPGVYTRLQHLQRQLRFARSAEPD